MSSLRYVVWFLLSVVALCVALLAFVISRQLPALDFGWVNGGFMLAMWIGVVVSLKRALLDDSPYGPSEFAGHRIPATTLDYRRR